jgi:basic amino acid/polyamine antiporter, APA family
MSDRPELRRILTALPLLFYGLGVIVGAGIYVAIGAVIARAGAAAPLAFLLAGVAAGATGLCYAELAGRFPEASGGVAYVRHAFGPGLVPAMAAIGTTLAVAISAASIARGAAHYIGVFLPLPGGVLAGGLVALFTAVAALGVRESVGLAAVMGAMEIAGLLVATLVGVAAAPEFHAAGMVPAGWEGWRGVFAGAFIAFFAFIGFETLANLAEETLDARRIVPLVIVGSIAASLALYLGVSIAAVLADSGADAPLLDLFGGPGGDAFALLGAVAVSNGVLVQVIMLARLFYGMAGNHQLPAVLARVHPRTRTPVPATLVAGGLVLAGIALASFDQLLVLANAATLLLFALVDLSLWRVQRHAPAGAGRFAAPRWMPPLAAALALLLLLAELTFTTVRP